MKSQSVLRKLSLGLAATLMVVAGACSSDSPSEPSPSPNPPPGSGGGGGTAYNVTVTANPAAVEAGETDPVVITVRATRADNGAAPPNGTAVQVSALTGSFGTPGGDSSAILQFTNGTAQVTYFVPAEAEGSVVVTANVAGSTGRATITIEQQDTFFISGVNPGSGSTVGGETVTITGSGFEPPARVAFGSANAQVLQVSPNSIRVRTPESPSPANQRATVPVTVTINVNEEEEASDTLNGAFTFSPGGDTQSPTILSLSPTTGANEGGTRVRIVGSGFSAPVQVEFGSGGTFLEAEVESVTANELVVRTPAATGFGQALRNSTVDLRVRNLESGLTSTFSGAFRYGTEVRITSLSPGFGPYFGGQLVTVFGQGFEAPVAVEMGGAAQSVVSVTGTEIVVRTVPIIANSCADQSGAVRVVNINSGDAASGPTYTYRVKTFEPVIFSVAPTSGSQNGGTTLTIRGENLIDPLAFVGGRPAEVLSVADNGTQITIRTPFLPREELATEACDANGDGTQGERFVATAVDITVRNRSTTCEVTFQDGFSYNPTDTSCRNDVGPAEPEPECSDGVDNDGDTDVDFPADAECTSADDDDESA